MKPLLLLQCIIVLVFAANPAIAKQSQKITIESLINERIYVYPLTTDNLIKLAAFFEMKGYYIATYDQMEMDMGSVGRVSVFKDRLFVRTWNNKVYYLDEKQKDIKYIRLLNDALREMFEMIPLMGNYNCHPDQVRFVDENLASKNLEPFDKIYLRYILLRYGKMDESKTKVLFRSKWLPTNDMSGKSDTERWMLKKHFTPLSIHLYPSVIRGYYEKIGGTVYIEQKKNVMKYATGESVAPNVAAFKTFIQKLFVQSIQFISTSESGRLKSEVKLEQEIQPTPGLSASIKKQPQQVGNKGTENATERNLYSKYNWMPMMLGLLRENDISIADPEILIFFVDEPYFDKLFSYMTEEEKADTKKFLASRFK